MYSAESSSSSIVAEMPRFRQHRAPRLAQFAQQVVVLHVACAHLQQVDVRLHHRRSASWSITSLTTSKPVRIGGLPQQFEPVFAQALKAVRRTARLERAAANELGAGPRDDFSAVSNLFFALDAARPSHHDHFRSADLHSAKVDHRAAGLEMPAGQFVGRHDPESTP